MRPLESSRRRVVGNHVLALGEVGPELSNEGSLIAVVQIAEHRLDSLGGFSSIVKGNTPEEKKKKVSVACSHNVKEDSIANLREKVVNNVVLNDAVKQVAANKSKLSVDSGQGTLDKGPVLGRIVRHLHVGVVEVGDGD